MRLRPLLESLLTTSIDAIASMGNFIDVLLPIICILQIVIAMILICFLLMMARRMHNVLSLFMFFSPTTVLQNSTVTTLLTTGTVPAHVDGIAFEYAERVVENTREAVLLTDRDLVIRDFNSSAQRLLGIERGVALAQALIAPPDSPGIGNAIAAIEDVINGTEVPPLQDTFKITTSEGIKIIGVRTIYLTEIGILAKGDSPADIRAVILQIDDITKQKSREEVIDKEVDRMKSMLKRVIPAPIVNQLAEGTESVSFAVQSASIGCIKVKFGNRDPTVENPFGGIHKLFRLFDEWITSFSQLSKVSVVAGEYVFAGGVFTATNKPEKHAEEATRFALKIIAQTEEVTAAVGPDVSILIGLNTGGPLVAGIMNSRRPVFQLFGVAVQIAHEVAEAGISGQVHVTRAVYELVYSHNFKVTERGDLKLKGGTSVHTYLITP
jgi:PAS domain-containing protein